VFFDADSEMAFLRRAADRCGIKIANPYAGALNVAHKAYPNMPSGRVARLAKSLDSLDENVPSFVDACQRALSVFLVAVEASRERVRWTFSHDGVNAPSIPVKSISKAFVDFNKLLPPQFIVLDLETTGLSCTRNEIIEIGAILIDVDRINDSDIALSPCFQTLVKPSKKIPKKITEINGITQEMVDREGIDLKEAMGQFLEFIGDLPLVTYNADFDMGFLYQAAEKCDLIISNRYTCALKRARRAFLGLPSYRLAYVAKVQGLSDENTHRAVGDSQRAASVFLASVESLGMKVRWTRPPVIER
jgi:DNA polymerase III epsilon subunit family exonuclease